MLFDKIGQIDQCIFGEITGRMSTLLPKGERLEGLGLVLCSQGEARFEVAGRSVRAIAGGMLFLAPAQLQEQWEIQPDFHARILAIPRDYIDLLGHGHRTAVMVDLETGGNPLVVLASPAFSLAQTLFRQLYSLGEVELPVDNKKRMLKYAVESLVEIFCAHRFVECREPGDAFQGLAGRFIELVLCNYRQHRFVGYYADLLHVSTKYLSRLIQDKTGLEASRWIARFVMAEARLLLAKPDLGVKQIACELNFVDMSTFGKYFRRYMGCTPVEYRLQKCH